MQRLNRREFLALGAGATIAAAAPPVVTEENSKPGDRDWQLTYAKFDARQKFRSPFIEGYCDRTSVRPGETIRFFLSTSEPAIARIDLYRMGYYGGSGARPVRSWTNRVVKPQPVPDMKAMRLRECQWKACAE